MRIDFYCNEDELGTPIEIANAIIKNRLDGIYDTDVLKIRRAELSEISEHIRVFLNHTERVV